MKDFKLTFETLGLLVTELTKMLTSTGKTYRVSIKEWRESRSLSQNALYWKWCGEVSKQASHISNDPDIWHEIFKKFYCPCKSIPIEGQEPITIKSTKKLDVGEMHHYLCLIERYCMDRHYVITIPTDSDYNKLKLEQDE